eukprot:CAMPEP_0197437346 /NCGR_PEP_ID=MMETSP1175-20131217/4609_1 /TAXON_ID=1003142 /ORGANISM="Triceratium dubium, Strain CCMP147" /LENGTH=62 /DNA_ID=CAMNT_0042966843 /DNA_START=60 /DNA_END=245 /DNA_ORIENTATION=-
MSAVRRDFGAQEVRAGRMGPELGQGLVRPIVGRVPHEDLAVVVGGDGGAAVLGHVHGLDGDA